MIGWLRIGGTDIDLPVVQTPGDNEHYLRRGFDGLYSTGGTLFLDEQCSIDPDAPTANWLVYGHNMADGSMFGELTRYRDKAFWQAHPTFTFDTLYETGTWQVVAALDTTLGADALPYYTFFDADTKLEWEQRVNAILELSLYDTGVTPEYGQQLLTLSTCGNTTPATRPPALLCWRCALAIDHSPDSLVLHFRWESAMMLQDNTMRGACEVWQNSLMKSPSALRCSPPTHALGTPAEHDQLNGNAPKYDIRDWSPDGSRMAKGISLTAEELKTLRDILNDMEL